ncbi:ABC transporter ATP-binding protein [Herbaspirillum sp. RTI4]|uniref:ABC transporter ATP-binding protein n=1 Tax=Herbaspirillum sp. RTI4 TaxID=3048640 RepID=UPI002AB4E16A|nr:ABC transporter ATP-binding protein [Herbaspirillum sp. RTI4]MDY7579768.1 ABC transporter ATP-binding protein [Herbaspirillum sp. RTI4]MEA9982742.1 ABC transporter ATP-binding protein [Herbaspirillum sp. RTI4]
MLEVKHLKVEFISHGKSIAPVDEVSFTVGANETVGLLGESGCGKSVTALSILRLFPLASKVRLSGSVTYQGRDLLTVDDADLRAIRGKQIAMIFQEPMTSLNPLQKIGAQLGEMLRMHTALSRSERDSKVIAMLQRVGLSRAEQLVNEYPHSLSGGMRQRVMIAMALLCDPGILICDEPTTALDVTIQAQILDLMRQLKQEQGTSILMITHDLGVVAEMCERVIVMYAGQVVEQSSVRDLFDAPAHPYTQALMRARPALDATPGQRLTAIPGSVPPPGMAGAGCRFAARCAKADDICREQMPALTEVASGHLARCWYPN